MYGKLAVAAGFAAGYVLGSKAGRQRYEEIVAQARKVAGQAPPTRLQIGLAK